MAFVYRGKKVDLGFGRGWLDVAPAASIRRIDKAIGHPLQITEAGRTWGQQDVHYQRYLRNGWPIALNPDTPSEHQKGLSIDSDEAQRFVALMADHGWIRTVYRWVNGKWTLVEEWHFEYFIARDNHRHEGGGSTPAPKPTPTPKEIAMADQVIVTEKDNNGNKISDRNRRVAFTNSDSGFNCEFSWLTLADADKWAKQVGMPAGALRFSDAGFDKYIGKLGTTVKA